MTIELTQQERRAVSDAAMSPGLHEVVADILTARLAQAAVLWSQRANEGLSASVLAAKAEAWEEGCTAGADYEGRRVSEYPYDWPDDVPRNPYRDQP